MLAAAPVLGGVLTGRALSGLSVGVATGAVAVLLRHHGTPRSGSLTALCALLGSAAGTALTALAAEALPALGPIGSWQSGYALHAVLALGCACAVRSTGALAVPGAPPRASAHADDDRPSHRLTGADGTRRFVLACTVGLCSWVTAGIVVALLPTYATTLLGTTDLVVASAGVVGFLLAASATSLVAGRWPARSELAVAPVLMAAGLAVVACSGLAGAVSAVEGTAVLVLGAAVAGAGMGLGFRAGLGAALAAAAPGRVADATSRYSACAYAGAATITLVLGGLAVVTGLAGAVGVAAVVVVVGVAALVPAVRRAFPWPRVEPGATVTPASLATPPGSPR